MIAPWLLPLWQRLRAEPDRSTQALLLAGPKGLGKRDFALAFAHALLCEHPDASGFACGRCASCLWIAEGHHPDLALVEPAAESADEAEEGGGKSERAASTSISIEQVRTLGEQLELVPHGERWRCVVMHPAEALNANAANALLKTLEEPPVRTLFILVSHQPRRLLPTIRSRCRVVPVRLPDRAAARAWLAAQGAREPELALALGGDAPMAALRCLEGDYLERRAKLIARLQETDRIDPIGATDVCHTWPLIDVLDWLQGWCYDLVRLRLAGDIRCHIDRLGVQQEIAARIDVVAMLTWERALAAARRAANHPLNARLVLEPLFLGYRDAFRH